MTRAEAPAHDTGARREHVASTLAWPLVERRRSPRAPFSGTDRRHHVPAPTRTNRLLEMVQSPPLEPFRWAAVAIGLIVATANISTTSYRRLSACVIEVVYAAIRTVRPVDVTGERAAVEIVLEIAFQSAVVLGTGAWWSPFAFSLVPAVLLAGLARGTRFALLATTPALAIISIRHVFVSVTISRGLRESALWAVLLLLVAVGSGLAHQVTRETVQQRSLALDRVGRLAEANALLSSLHRVAQTLPASLDLDEVLDSTLGRVRDLLPLDIAAVLLAEPSDGTWSVARQTGGRPLRGLTAEHLPLPARSALTHMGTWSETELGAPVGIGFDPSSASGLYAALRARGTVVGLLVIEGERPGQFGAREVELVNGLVEAFGISIDNARFFARLRSIGADEERTRIARDLHDEIGQSLTHLGFELDRAVRHAQRGDDVQASLVEVRDQCAASCARSERRCTTCAPRSPTAPAWRPRSGPSSSGSTAAPT